MSNVEPWAQMICPSFPFIVPRKRGKPDFTGTRVNYRPVRTTRAAPPQGERVVSGEVRAECSLQTQLGAEHPRVLGSEHWSGRCASENRRNGVVLQSGRIMMHNAGTTAKTTHERQTSLMLPAYASQSRARTRKASGAGRDERPCGSIAAAVRTCQTSWGCSVVNGRGWCSVPVLRRRGAAIGASGLARRTSREPHIVSGGASDQRACSPGRFNHLVRLRRPRRHATAAKPLPTSTSVAGSGTGANSSEPARTPTPGCRTGSDAARPFLSPDRTAQRSLLCARGYRCSRKTVGP